MGPLRIRALIATCVLVFGACGASTGSEIAASPGSVAQVDTVTVAPADPDPNTITGPAPTTATASSAVDTPTTTESSSTTAAPTTTATPPGDYVNLVGGGQIDLNSIEGQDTVLWFWAPW